MSLPADSLNRPTISSSTNQINANDSSNQGGQALKPTSSQYQSSVVSISKEREMVSEQQILDEVRKNIETEVDREVKEAGVETVGGSVDLPSEITKETGLTEVGEEVKIPSQPTIKLPLNDEKIRIGLKEPDVAKAILWLANWCARQFKIAKEKALNLIGVKS